MKHITFSFAAGFMTSALLFGGTVAYAAGVLAERSTNRVFVDAQEVQLDAYLINGKNYVQLREIGEAVGFNVYWDGAAQIDTTAPYTGEAPVTQVRSNDTANSAYTQDAYHALRQVVSGAERSDSIPMTQETYEAMQRTTAAISEWPCYHMTRSTDGAVLFSAKYPSAYEDAAAYCQPFIDGLAGLSDRDKVRQLAYFVCDRLTYDASKSPSPRTVLVSDSVSRGNCMGYAHNFKFLCDMAGIPCIFTHSAVHQWNQVYVEGHWWHVDVCAMDAGDDPTTRQYSPVLYETVQGASYQQTEPELTAFAREVIVSG